MIINTRKDLETLQGTQAYDEFLVMLRGSMTRKENRAVYPDGYNTTEYTGPAIEPIWVDVEDLSTIQRFGFTKEQLEGQA